MKPQRDERQPDYVARQQQLVHGLFALHRALSIIFLWLPEHVAMHIPVALYVDSATILLEDVIDFSITESCSARDDAECLESVSNTVLQAHARFSIVSPELPVVLGAERGLDLVVAAVVLTSD